MSRTDVHTPYWVRQRDPAWHECFVEEHDHSKGPCDLEIFLAAGNSYVRTRCYIEMRWTGRNLYCGCRMCTGHHERHHENKQARMKWHTERQELLKLQDHDLE